MDIIPYGRQSIEEDDIRAVVDALRSDWLTQGPKVAEFERALAARCGAKFAVVFNNGTTALQAAYAAAGIGPGDELITTPITFAATANAALWLGAKPIFADVDPVTGLLDPAEAEKAATSKTRALVSVDYAGMPVDYDAFRNLCRRKGWIFISDACHSLGAEYKGEPVGSLADMSVLSFHPVKAITTGEGGAVLTDSSEYHEKLLRLRHHGIRRGTDWEYAIEDLSFNGRLTDFQSALGLSQLRKLDRFVAAREEAADRYDEAFAGWPELQCPKRFTGRRSAWHLYAVRLKGPLAGGRREVFKALRERGIGVQVHYIPVHWHPIFSQRGYSKNLCPNAEAFYEKVISLPIYPGLTPAQQGRVVAVLRSVLDGAAIGARAR